MSTHPPHGHDDHEHGGDAGDAIDFTKVIWVGVISLAIFAVGVVWAARILKSETAMLEETRGRSKAVEVGRTEIGIVDLVPFNGDKRLGVWKAGLAQRLGSYGWVDKAKGIVHIPIDTAMDQVAAGAAPVGAPR
jgi:hypothetical protein